MKFIYVVIREEDHGDCNECVTMCGSFYSEEDAIEECKVLAKSEKDAYTSYDYEEITLK